MTEYVLMLGIIVMLVIAVLEIWVNPFARAFARVARRTVLMLSS